MPTRKNVAKNRQIMDDAAYIRHKLRQSRDVIYGRLLALTASPNEKVAITAVKECLDRMIGKAETPTQEATGNALLEAFRLMRSNAAVNQRAVEALTAKYAPKVIEASFAVVDPAPSDPVE